MSQTMTRAYSFSERANLAFHPLAKKLFNLMEAKKSSLCVAADLTTANSLLQLADQIGPSIAIFKTHIDIVEDFTPQCITELQILAKKHNFILFEDRKFADIGNTVLHQYSGGIYHIADWAPIVNAHSLPGPGVVEGLKKVGAPKNNGLLLLAEMSSKGQLADEAYTKATVEMAKDHSDFVIGFICQKRLTDDPKFIHMTPGVKMAKAKDTLGQQYRTPEKVILEDQSDVIIVGRGITEAEDPSNEAEKYRQAGWEAYIKRM